MKKFESTTGESFENEELNHECWIRHVNSSSQANEIVHNAFTSMIKLIVIGGFCIDALLAI